MKKYIFPALSFFIPFTIFVFTMNPDTGWLDSPEFIAASYTLAMPHPPSHPLYVMLAKFFSFMPAADIAARITFFSALTGSLCCLIFYRIFILLMEKLIRNSGIAGTRSLPVIALFFSILLSLTHGMWLQSTRAEVYALNLLIILLIIAVILYFEDNPSLVLALTSFLAGTGMANHHFLVFLFILSLLLYFLFVKNFRAAIFSKKIFIALFCFILPVLMYFYLPVRGNHNPEMSWGTADSLTGIADIISTRIFADSLGTDQIINAAVLFENLGKNFQEGLKIFIDECTPLIFMLSIGGFLLLLRDFPKLFLFFLCALAFNFFSKTSMTILDSENPDDYGYFLLSITLITLFSGIIPSCISAILEKKRKILSYAAYAFIIAIIAFAGYSRTDYSLKSGMNQSDFYDTESVREESLINLPSETVVFQYYYHLFFQTLYEKTVENERPDITPVHMSFYSRMGDSGYSYRKYIMKSHPFLEDIIASYENTSEFPVEEVLKFAGKKPVFLELTHSLEFPDSNLHFNGFYFRVSGSPVQIDDQDAILEKQKTFISNLFLRSRWIEMPAEILTRRIMLVKHTLASNHFTRMNMTKNAGFEHMQAELYF
jgi:hypothetical protein